jgi:hypothetical protein
VAGPLAQPPQLPRGTVPGLSAASPAGNLASLFPVVTPAPAAPATPSAGKAQQGPMGASAGADTALTAETGVMGTGQGRLIVVLLTLAAGIAAFGIWFAASGPARRMVGSLARRRGHHTR